MFNKNSFLKVEFLPDGRLVFSSKFNKNTNPEVVADFINSFIIRKELDKWLENIYELCKQKGLQDIGEEICERVIAYQNHIDIRPASRSGRNPLIKPSQVMRNFSAGDNHE